MLSKGIENMVRTRNSPMGESGEAGAGDERRVNLILHRASRRCAVPSTHLSSTSSSYVVLLLFHYAYFSRCPPSLAQSAAQREEDKCLLLHSGRSFHSRPRSCRCTVNVTRRVPSCKAHRCTVWSVHSCFGVQKSYTDILIYVFTRVICVMTFSSICCTCSSHIRD